MAPFVPRQRKHRKRAKAAHGSAAQDAENSNVPAILPASVQEKEAKKSALKDALQAKQPVMSSKKRKRLDKYIVGEAISTLIT